tara:strand:+ start:933 stop:1919 length:987 start_codon:yes stop_codon:yes gene_type:complete
MKFVTYSLGEGTNYRFGFKKNEYVVDIIRASIWANENQGDFSYLEIPSTLKKALENWDFNLKKLQELNSILPEVNIQSHSGGDKPIAILESDVSLLPPVPNPQSFRDFYAFEKHVRAARKLRGLDMNPDWYKIPIFYFSNPASLYGHNSKISYPNGTTELDFELEFAVIIANGGTNITENNAQKYIAGYTICNDWSARDLQREEMGLNLGPAKGKDFATSFGPYLVTPDELEDSINDSGKLDLKMKCYVNDKIISDGNTNDLYHPFTRMIERASKNARLLPGDYLGSGTVGTGCILELRPENTGGWIKKGDTVRMEIEKLGILQNKII